MHIYMITRGIKHDVDRMINELSSQYLPFTYKGQPCVIQTSVRPVQLWEIAFPEEHLEFMSKSLFHGNIMRPEYKNKFGKWIYWLRKLIGLEEIPEYIYKKEDPTLPIWQENVDRIGIGIKRDYRFADGTEGI